MGINIDRMILLAFAIGSGLAAVGGLMWGSKYGQISPLMGLLPGLKAFVAAVIGGVGSIAGAVVGGYALASAKCCSSACCHRSIRATATSSSSAR